MLILVVDNSNSLFISKFSIFLFIVIFALCSNLY